MIHFFFWHIVYLQTYVHVCIYVELQFIHDTTPRLCLGGEEEEEEGHQPEQGLKSLWWRRCPGIYICTYLHRNEFCNAIIMLIP